MEDQQEKGKETTVNEDYDIPKKSIAYKVFLIVSSIAVLFSGLMTVAQILTFAIMGGNFIQSVLRVYILAFCIMFMFAELQFEFLFKVVPPMRNWIYRGFLYSFVGVVGVEEAFATLAEEYPRIPTVKDKATSVFVKVSAVGMFCVGVIYIAMGILCLKSVYEKVKASYNDQVEKFTEARQVDKK